MGAASSSGDSVGSLEVGGFHRNKSDILTAVADRHSATTRRSRQKRQNAQTLEIICSIQNDENTRVKALNKAGKAHEGFEKLVPKVMCVGFLKANAKPQQLAASVDIGDDETWKRA